jgi:hypothetical protein
MSHRQTMSIHNEEDDSSVGDGGGCDFRHLYLLLSLSRKLFVSSGFKYSMLPHHRRSNLLVVALSSLEKRMPLRATSVSRSAPIMGSHTLLYVSC